jgi:Leucine-rich repeat (LRR) protein
MNQLSLSNLPNDLFKGLDRLNTLYMEDNQISELPNGIFQGLSSLKLLYVYIKVKDFSLI